jgi:hypothetical protein
MKGLLRLLVIVLAVAIRLLAQPNSAPATRLYSAYAEASPSGTAYALTIQQSGSVATRRQIQFSGGAVYCSVACTITLSIQGTAAANTLGTATALDTRAPSASASVYTNSDAGTGTMICRYVLSAGQQLDITPNGLHLGTTTQGNITLRSSVISGDVKLLLMWSEPQ